MDELLPDVLIFVAGTDLHDHPLVTDGRLILQVGACRAHNCMTSRWYWIVVQLVGCCKMWHHGHAWVFSGPNSTHCLCLHRMLSRKTECDKLCAKHPRALCYSVTASDTRFAATTVLCHCKRRCMHCFRSSERLVILHRKGEACACAAC